MENKRAHLEMIQGVINRMAGNSFQLKGWSVTLVSALFALAAADANPMFVYLAYFPAISFWILDGYFLWQERLFRALFDHVRGLNEEKIDFSMNTAMVKEGVASWFRTAISTTLLIFHGTIIAAVIIVMAISLQLKG